MNLPELLAQTERVHRELPVEPIIFGGSATLILFILLWITTRFNPDR